MPHLPRHDDYAVCRRHRYWAVMDGRGELVCLAVYKRGAYEVVRRLMEAGRARRAAPTKSVGASAEVELG